MNFELFIAKRLILTKQYKSSISAPIIKIAISAISLGIIIMMISISTSLGLKNKIREKISGFNGDIQIINFDTNESDITVKPIYKNQNFYLNDKHLNGVENLHAFITKPSIIRTDKDFEYVIAKGIDSLFNKKIFREYLTEGVFPDFSGEQSEDVLISKAIADRLNLKLGDSFNMYFVKRDIAKPPSVIVFKIAGIYDSGIIQFDKNTIFVDMRHLQRLNKWKEDQVGGFELFLDDFYKIQTYAKQIYNEISIDLNTLTVLEKYPSIFEWIKLFDFNTTLIIVIMIFVAGINMITALLVLILERTQTIGILKSLGANNWSIRKIFLYNAAFLIFKGLFWGNLIGLSLLLIQKFTGVITLNPQTYYVRKAPIYINLYYIFLLNIGTLFLCYTMMILPSYIITKISPVKAIKFS